MGDSEASSELASVGGAVMLQQFQGCEPPTCYDAGSCTATTRLDPDDVTACRRRWLGKRNSSRAGFGGRHCARDAAKDPGRRWPARRSHRLTDSLTQPPTHALTHVPTHALTTRSHRVTHIILSLSHTFTHTRSHSHPLTSTHPHPVSHPVSLSYTPNFTPSHQLTHSRLPPSHISPHSSLEHFSSRLSLFT